MSVVRIPRRDGPATLADWIGLLKDQAGGYDRFAEELGTRRQTVIRWVKHGVFPEDYVDELRARGVPANLLLRAPRAEIEERLRKVEQEVAEIRRMLG